MEYQEIVNSLEELKKVINMNIKYVSGDSNPFHTKYALLEEINETLLSFSMHYDLSSDMDRRVFGGKIKSRINGNRILIKQKKNNFALIVLQRNVEMIDTIITEMDKNRMVQQAHQDIQELENRKDDGFWSNPIQARIANNTAMINRGIRPQGDYYRQQLEGNNRVLKDAADRISLLEGETGALKKIHDLEKERDELYQTLHNIKKVLKVAPGYAPDDVEHMIVEVSYHEE